jgi:hypothetical protein
MAKEKYIFSTLTADQAYTNYGGSNNGVQQPSGRVVIKGGSNVANRDTLVTPLGVMTKVTAEQYEILQANEDFQRHLEGKFISVQDKKYEPEVVTADMETRDGSAPFVPQDGLGAVGEDDEDADKAKSAKKAK